MAFFRPDRYISRITLIDIKRDVLDAGYTHILLDMDNTILPRDTHQVPADIRAWLDAAQEQGVTLCLLSNNFHHGVYEWADRLELPIVAKAVKPLPHGFIMARRKIGGTRKDTLMVGDQLITDVLGAHLCGMKAFMVCPLVEVDLKHTLMLRNVERLFMGDAKPEPGMAASRTDASTEG